MSRKESFEVLHCENIALVQEDKGTNEKREEKVKNEKKKKKKYSVV